MVRLSLKRTEPQGNRVLIVRPYYTLDPKPMRATPGQAELCRKVKGGPNPLVVQLFGMTCGKK